MFNREYYLDLFGNKQSRKEIKQPMPTPADIAITALCLWREARVQGHDGMQAVCFVIRNRAIKRVSSAYREVTKPLQFSSMTDTRDRQLALYPVSLDMQWGSAQAIAESILNGFGGPDPTQGATLYYNPDAIEKGKTIKLKDGSEVAFPKTWNPDAVEETITVGTRPQQHIFFIEK